MKELAVIIINYNSSKYTLECVHSVLERTSLVNYQVVVVDNNSELDDYANLKKNLIRDEKVSLCRSDLNTGFGGGNMFGAKYANSKYLLFLNNDVLLMNDAPKILKEYMDTHPEAGVCTAQNFDEDENLVPCFDHNKGLRRLLFGRGFLEKTNPNRYPKRKLEYDQPITVDWVNGACMFIRSEVFDRVRGFDTKIFLYWEEMDICHRIRKSGFVSVLVPEARILHYQGVSIGKSKNMSRESYISYLYVIRKNFGRIKYFLIKTYLAAAIMLKPKKWYLLPVVLSWDPMALSLKHRQEVRHFDEARARK